MSGSPTDRLFFAYWERNNARQPVLEAFSQRDGKPQGDVLRLPAWPLTVQGPVRANDGSLWFTISSGPCVRDGTAGGNPAPNTCSGSVVRFDPDARTSRVVLKAPSSLLIGNAIPSPDGTQLAYQSGGCDTSYFNSHIVVRDLKTGKESTIGAGATPCHLFWSMAWSADGSRLLATFAPSTLSPSSTFVPKGTCQEPGSGELAIFSTAASTEIKAADLTPARNGCGYTTAVFDRQGVVAVETCGDHGLGPASLVQLNNSLIPASRFDLAPGSDPTSLAPDPTGSRILVDEYEGPTDGGPAGTNHGPINWIQIFDGNHLQLIVRSAVDTASLRSATF